MDLWAFSWENPSRHANPCRNRIHRSAAPKLYHRLGAQGLRELVMLPNPPRSIVAPSASNSSPNPRDFQHFFKGQRAIGAPAIVLMLTLGIAACSGGGDASTTANAPTPGPAPTTSTGVVKSFAGADACTDLETTIEAGATAMVREQINYIKAGYQNGVLTRSSGMAVTSSPTSANTAASDSASSSASSYSQTNVQVASVDEPDFTKNDGQYLYQLASDGTGQMNLVKYGVWPAAQARRVSTHSWPRNQGSSTEWDWVSSEGMYLLDQQQVLTLEHGGGDMFWPLAMNGLTAARNTADMAIGALPYCAMGSYCPPWTITTRPAYTKLRLLDTRNSSGTISAAAPAWTQSLAGHYIGSRRIGQQVYVVTQAQLRLPDSIVWNPEIASTASTAQIVASYDTLLASNLAKIQAATLAEWLAPIRKAEGRDPAAAPTQAECASFAKVDASTRLAWLRVHRIDLGSKQVTHQTILAEGSALYMSPTSIVVSTQRWVEKDSSTSTANGALTYVPVTDLHRFAVGSDGAVSYASSGQVSGTLLNRYAIDETSDGTLRLAVSQPTVWTGGTTTSQPYTTLLTMQAKAGKLEQVGATGKIAEGEMLQSARFVGDRAYLVTFRQVDPFFVFDLSNPAAPKQLGELKIPGFSTYLHPIGSTRMLGIGYDGGGWPRKIKASLFDVSNPANPVEQSTLLLGDSYTGSDALWNPHALTVYRPTGDSDWTVAMPIWSYAYTTTNTSMDSALRLLKVSETTGLSLRGSISLTDLIDSNSGFLGGYAVSRGVFLDRVAIAVSDNAIRLAPLDTPSSTIATVKAQ